jgi:hypothetical protein
MLRVLERVVHEHRLVSCPAVKRTMSLLGRATGPALWPTLWASSAKFSLSSARKSAEKGEEKRNGYVLEAGACSFLNRVIVVRALGFDGAMRGAIDRLAHDGRRRK